MTIKTMLLSAVPGFLRPHWDRLEASPLGYRLARGAFWSLAGAAISRGLALLSSLLVARILGKSGFGEMGIIQSTASLFGVLAGFGLGLTAAKHVAEFRTKDPARAGRILAMSAVVAWVTGTVAAAVLVACAPWLAARTLGAPQLSGALRVSALLVWLGAVNGAQTGALAGFEAFKTIAKVNLTAGLANFPLVVLGAWWAGLEGAVWGLVIGLGLNALLNRLALQRHARAAGILLAFSGWLQEWKVLWHFSLPTALRAITVLPTYWLCNVLVARQPNGFAELGAFNAANQWYTALVFLPDVTATVLLPIISERLGTSGWPACRKAVTHTILVNLGVVVPAALLVMTLSYTIMGLYGGSFAGNWPVLVIGALTALIMAVQAPLTQVIVVTGHIWASFYTLLAWGAVFVCLTTLAWLPGALGLALARAIAQAVYLLLTVGLVITILRVRARDHA